MLAARPELLETAELALLAAGVVVGLVVVVRAIRREPGGAALRLGHLPAARFTLVDVIGYVLLTSVVAAACAKLFGPEPAPIDERSGALQVSAPRQATVSLITPLCGAIFLLIVSRRRVTGGLASWGLTLSGLRRAVVPGLWRYVAVWPLCAGALFLTHALIQRFFPDHPFDEHATLGLLRRARDAPAWVPAFLIAGAVVAAPLAEELFFRGVIQSMIATAARSPWAGVLGSALLFGAVHSQNPETVPPLIVFGVALGVAFARTQSLAVPLIMHFLFNAKTILWLGLGAEA